MTVVMRKSEFSFHPTLNTTLGVASGNIERCLFTYLSFWFDVTEDLVNSPCL